jgi:hypothetical protein
MSKYASDNKLDLIRLRHDLVSLVMPFETFISLSEPPSDPQLTLLRDEVLKSLKAVINELQSLPDVVELKSSRGLD